jgi:hypothetical protein
MQKPTSGHEQKAISFLAEKVKRMSTSGDSQEMMATIRDYLQTERSQHAAEIYEHTAHTAQVIPFARMRAV